MLPTTVSCRPRSITHGTCALNGQHPPGSTYAEECPILRRERIAQKAASAAENEEGAISLQGPRNGDSPAPEDSTTSRTVFRYGRAGRSGRPAVPIAEQRRKARDRARGWRARYRRLPTMATRF